MYNYLKKIKQVKIFYYFIYNKYLKKIYFNNLFWIIFIFIKYYKINLYFKKQIFIKKFIKYNIFYKKKSFSGLNSLSE
jgi:hypothetical protein